MHAHSPNRTPPNIPINLPPPVPGGVCGSLDPPGRSKRTAKSGWRYIQLTDTLDELRVLLPPRPAAIYANLLKVEAHTSAKNDAESLQEIRYLKAVVVKRCQKLAQETVREVSVTKGSRSVSVVQAPVDFKVQRLERWWEATEPHVKVKSSSNHSKRRAHAERPSRMQTSSSTTTLSPNQNHPSGTPAVQSQYSAAPPTSPAARRNRPAPLTVPSAGQARSTQSSPLVPQTPYSPNVAAFQASAHLSTSQSPRMASSRDYANPQQIVTQRPVYTNSQMASPLETPYNPSFDPNQSLAANQYRPETQSRMYNQHTYNSADTLTDPTGAQVDLSHLKMRFHTQYSSSAADSNSSPSSGGSLPTTHAKQKSTAYIHAGAGHTPYIRPHASFSVPLPSAATAFEKDHRRRATVDCSDTDRSVVHPKGYMYRAGGTSYNDVSPEIHAYSMQGARTEGDHSPSVLQRAARLLGQSLSGVSPRSSPGSQGSSRLHGSPGPVYHAEGSPHSLNSPGRASYQTQGYGSTLSAEHAYAHSSGSVKNGSPNLLPPDSAISRPRRGSNESVMSNSKTALGTQGVEGSNHPTRQLRRTTSRRGLRDPSDSTAVNSQPVVPPSEYYAQTKPPRGSIIPPLDAQQPIERDTYQRGRTHRGERSPRRRAYEASPRREGAVIPDMTDFTPATSNRNSRYTSGESSVSEPVIPDVSLIMEAEFSRSKGDRVRRRLVPLQSSSEEGGSQYATEFEYSDSSSEDDGHNYVQQNGPYKPPYRTRDGYGSGAVSEAGGGNSRAPSRAPSRSPSRGILKRSNSVCSQRSNKSVRLEIPRDRRALEEVRDAEDKVERARKHLEDLQRRKIKSTDPEIKKATEELHQAQESVKKKDADYQAILAAQKARRAEQTDSEPHYV